MTIQHYILAYYLQFAIALAALVGFYFGSSSGSQKKDDIIAAGKPPMP